MVRVKHRYLLVQILYPSPSSFNSHSHPHPPTTTTPKSPTALSTLSIHAPTSDTITPSTLLRLLRENLDLLFGDHGAGAVGPSLQIKYWSNATSTFIVRCARAVVRLVWASLTFVRALPAGAAKGGRGMGMASGSGRAGGQGDGKGEVEVVMRVVRVSGTIRKCEEEAIRRARALVGRAKGLEMVREAGITLGVRGEEGYGVDGINEDEGSGGADVVMADDDDDDSEDNDND